MTMVNSAAAAFLVHPFANLGQGFLYISRATGGSISNDGDQVATIRHACKDDVVIIDVSIEGFNERD